MNYEKIEKQLINHEGEKLKPYRCLAEKLTIGVGRNLEGKGISKEESRHLLKNDILECYRDLSDNIFQRQFESFPENIQHILINMRFQLGPQRFRKFRKMISAVMLKSWPDMIKEMKDSAWYRQVPNRANDLIKMIEEVMG